MPAERKMLHVELAADLKRRVKAKAAAEDTSMTQVVTALLEGWVGGGVMRDPDGMPAGWAALHEELARYPGADDPMPPRQE